MIFNTIYKILVLLLFETQYTVYCGEYSQKLCSSIYPKDAKNLILVLMSMHNGFNEDLNECEEFIETRLTEVIQMNYFIEQFNEKISAFTNLTVGIKICDVCSEENIAKILLVENLSYLDSNSSNLTLIGKFFCKKKG